MSNDNHSPCPYFHASHGQRRWEKATGDCDQDIVFPYCSFSFAALFSVVCDRQQWRGQRATAMGNGDGWRQQATSDDQWRWSKAPNGDDQWRLSMATINGDNQWRRSRATGNGNMWLQWVTATGEATAVLEWCIGQLLWDSGVRKVASFWLRLDAYSRMIDFFNVSFCFLLCMSLFSSLSEKE